MDRLWTPWRYRYVATEDRVAEGCPFCRQPAANQDEKHFILHRSQHCYVMLNLFPYGTGHLLVIPFAHVATLEECPEGAFVEMSVLGRRAESILRATYRCHGLNLGWNIGSAAGAGVAPHVHLHVLPRWNGDANFMTTLGETRVLPEDLPTTYARLKPLFAEAERSKPLSAEAERLKPLFAEPEQ